MSLGITSPSGKVVADVFIYVGVISVALLVLITFLIIFFLVRYRRSKHPEPSDIRGATWLEIAWTVLPTILVLTMFYYGLTGFQSLKTIPKGAMKVKVISSMWVWRYEYENGVKSDVLRIPAGKDVVLMLTSLDVIHSFYVPAFKVKMDAVPGMENRLFLKPTRAGTYDVLCAEYCGLRHSYMLSKVEVLPEEEFQRWSQVRLEEIKTQKVPRGLQILQEKGCAACHTLDGSPLVGPTLKGLFGKSVTVVTAGKEQTVTADEEYIKRSILQPGGDVVKGFPAIMPPLTLNDEEMNAIISYLKELN
jgi:cytochrome c oxidase subunit II